MRNRRSEAHKNRSSHWPPGIQASLLGEALVLRCGGCDYSEPGRIQVLNRLVRRELDLGAQSVVLDLSAVQEADTKIVAVLMLARRRAHHLGVTLRIIVSEHVWSILELCNCAQPSWFEVHDHAEMGTVETADAGESPAACHGAWPSELFDSKAGEQTIGEAGLSEERSDAMARSTPRRRGRSLLAMLVTFGAILAGTGHRGAASDYDSACAHCDAPGEQGTFGQRMGTRN